MIARGYFDSNKQNQEKLSSLMFQLYSTKLGQSNAVKFATICI